MTSVVSVKLSRSVVELSAYERYNSCIPFLLLMINKLCSFISGGFSVHAQVQLHFHFWLPPAGGWCWHSSRVGLHLGRWAGVCQDRYADFRHPLLCSHSYCVFLRSTHQVTWCITISTFHICCTEYVCAVISVDVTLNLCRDCERFSESQNAAQIQFCWKGYTEKHLHIVLIGWMPLWFGSHIVMLHKILSLMTKNKVLSVLVCWSGAQFFKLISVWPSGTTGLFGSKM